MEMKYDDGNVFGGWGAILSFLFSLEYESNRGDKCVKNRDEIRSTIMKGN